MDFDVRNPEKRAVMKATISGSCFGCCYSSESGNICNHPDKAIGIPVNCFVEDVIFLKKKEEEKPEIINIKNVSNLNIKF